jgi:hypothetical protein
MAAPNLKSATLVVAPDRALYHLTSTSLVQLIAAVPTGYAYFIEQISVCNKGTASANITITIRDSGAEDWHVCSKRACQIKNAFNAAQGRAHILNEGDSVWGKLEAAGAVDVVIPYTKAHE